MSVRFALGLALLAATLFGASGVFASAAFDEISVGYVTQARVLGGALAFLPYALWKRQFPTRSSAVRLVVFGATLATVMYTYFVAIELLGVGPGATIQFIAPVYLLVWYRLVDGAPTPRQAWLAAAVAVLGVALVAGAFDTSGLSIAGLGAGILASGAFAIYLHVGESLSNDVPPAAVMAYGFGTAALIWLAIEPIDAFPTDISSTAWWQLAYIVVLGSAVPFAMEIVALKTIPGPLIGLVATWEPVVGAGLAWMFLSQRLSLYQVIGVVLVVVSIGMIQIVAGSGELDIRRSAHKMI